ncbi:hypothetical protein QTP86_032739 [Hemibagrus guttatus]|nr:hypothetical protein QTP86_032739 [Hemibagrus guttatus]
MAGAGGGEWGGPWHHRLLDGHTVTPCDDQIQKVPSAFYKRKHFESTFSRGLQTATAMKYYDYSGQLCDMIVEAGGVQFQAHRQALWDMSLYFRVLTSRWSSPGQVVYTIPGVAPNIMRSIIQYAYSKRIRITQRNVQDLMVAADYLFVSDIVHLCKQFLEKRLCPENCREIRRLASTHFWPDLYHQSSLMMECSLPYQLGVSAPSAYFQRQAILLGVSYSSGQRRQTPYTRPTERNRTRARNFA